MEFALNDDQNYVIIKCADGGKIGSGEPEALLLYGIIEKLEEIRCAIIDVETTIAEASSG